MNLNPKNNPNSLFKSQKSNNQLKIGKLAILKLYVKASSERTLFFPDFQPFSSVFTFKLETTGIEPATSGLQSQRSPN